MPKTVLLVLLAAAPLAAAPAPSVDGTTTYRIDPAASQVVLHVDRSGLFSFLGHAHEIAAPVAAGTVTVDLTMLERSSVRVEFEASALEVTGKDEPTKDVAEVQRTMQSARVLDVARFPRIVLASRAVRVAARDAGHLRLRLAADLTLHGVIRPVTVEIDVEIRPDRLTATGTLVVKQTDFGIEPVTAGGGTVRVKNEVEAQFSFVARPQPHTR